MAPRVPRGVAEVVEVKRGAALFFSNNMHFIGFELDDDAAQ